MTRNTATLRGAVASQAEWSVVDRIAKSAIGGIEVDDQIVVRHAEDSMNVDAMLESGRS